MTDQQMAAAAEIKADLAAVRIKFAALRETYGSPESPANCPAIVHRMRSYLEESAMQVHRYIQGEKE